jgi:hypothetical protein
MRSQTARKPSWRSFVQVHSQPCGVPPASGRLHGTITVGSRPRRGRSEIPLHLREVPFPRKMESSPFSGESGLLCNVEWALSALGSPAQSRGRTPHIKITPAQRSEAVAVSHFMASRNRTSPSFAVAHRTWFAPFADTGHAALLHHSQGRNQRRECFCRDF